MGIYENAEVRRKFPLQQICECDQTYLVTDFKQIKSGVSWGKTLLEGRVVQNPAEHVIN